MSLPVAQLSQPRCSGPSMLDAMPIWSICAAMLPACTAKALMLRASKAPRTIKANVRSDHFAIISKALPQTMLESRHFDFVRDHSQKCRGAGVTLPRAVHGWNDRLHEQDARWHRPSAARRAQLTESLIFPGGRRLGLYVPQRKAGEQTGAAAGLAMDADAEFHLAFPDFEGGPASGGDGTAAQRYAHRAGGGIDPVAERLEGGEIQPGLRCSNSLSSHRFPPKRERTFRSDAYRRGIAGGRRLSFWAAMRNGALDAP